MMLAALTISQWVICGSLIAAMVGAFVILKTLEKLQLKRMRAMMCPNCGKQFVIARYSAVQWWMARDADVNSGFYLKCDDCNVEFKYGRNFKYLGQAA